MTSMVRMDSWEEVSDTAKKANAVTILENNTTGDAFLLNLRSARRHELEKGTEVMIFRADIC